MRFEDKKVEFVKVGENVNRVKLSSIYDHKLIAYKSPAVQIPTVSHRAQAVSELNIPQLGALNKQRRGAPMSIKSIN